MLKTNFGQTRYLGLLFALSITFLIISNMVAGRLVHLGGVTFSVSEFPFPLCYLLGWIITEVYGYKQARLATWMSLSCMVLAMVSVALCLVPPSPDFFKDDAAFQTVFSSGPRIAFSGIIALFSGDILNSYVLAKMKIWSKGKQLWLRFLTATVIAEFANTFLFFGVAFFGVWQISVLFEAIIAGWIIKTSIEMILLPITYPVVAWLKKYESIDYFDTNTNFNPFILNIDKD